jgi:hypothetical protein
MMCTILQLCFTCYIAENILLWDLVYVKEKFIKWEFYAVQSFGQVYTLFDLMAHSLFALKYWIVALKTREIMMREPDTLLK